MSEINGPSPRGRGRLVDAVDATREPDGQPEPRGPAYWDPTKQIGPVPRSFMDIVTGVTEATARWNKYAPARHIIAITGVTGTVATALFKSSTTPAIICAITTLATLVLLNWLDGNAWRRKVDFAIAATVASLKGDPRMVDSNTVEPDDIVDTDERIGVTPDTITPGIPQTRQQTDPERDRVGGTTA